MAARKRSSAAQTPVAPGKVSRHSQALLLSRRDPEAMRTVADRVVLDAVLPDGRWAVWVAGLDTVVVDVRALPAPEGMERVKQAIAAWRGPGPLDVLVVTRRPFLIYDALNDLDLPYRVESHDGCFYFAVGPGPDSAA
ncbi:MAG: hypothetical protein K6U14_01465 [Firmicutes bacterium]|nr:hypothetical protein [Alicyclobacillaceae bacterium]MCL6496288.1 hypothetical protein [Bacillota bacterium]